MTARVRRLIEYNFAEHNETAMNVRTIQMIVKQVTNKAGISKHITY